MRLVRLLAVNAGLIALGLVGIELIFGSWLRENRIRQLNVLSDLTLEHDVSSLYDRGAAPVLYRRDRYGFRGDYGEPGEIDILSVGGSTTDQKYISEDETWQAVLQRHFASEGRRARIANAGVDGHSTIGHVRSFEWWFPHVAGLSPRYVLFFVGVNDLHLDAQAAYDRLDHPAAESPWVDRFRERSAIYAGYRTLVATRRSQLVGVGHRRVDFDNVEWVEEPRRSHHAERNRRRLEAYAERLRTLARSARELGAEPIFVTQLIRTYKLQDGGWVGTRGTQADTANGLDLYELLSAFNRTTLRTCLEVEAICIDLATDLAPELEDSDFYDFHHATPSGTAKIGDYLHRKLRNELDL